MNGERLVVEDSLGYTIEVDDNWGGLESAKEKLASNPQEDIVFIAITNPCDGYQECVSLTIEQAEKFSEELQSLIKALKG